MLRKLTCGVLHRAVLKPVHHSVRPSACMSFKTPKSTSPCNRLFGDQIQPDPAQPSSKSPALHFQVQATDGKAARTAQMQLPHFLCETPMFMPVGTKGSVKGLTVDMLEEAKCHLILGNTYHLGNQPGAATVEKLGGLHNFTGWRRAMLTDSGGFQMVSLLHLADIREEGVTFQSPVDGSSMLLTPEHSMRIQNQLGADIMMALDDVVSSVKVDADRFREATLRTTRWIDRCIEAHARPREQNLFAIVQGGLDVELRNISLRDLTLRDLPGYAIGGLAGGEDKDSFWRVVAQCAAALPPGKPRYVMGVGFPVDIVVCTALGADMYDSVFPTRTARFGVALASCDGGQLKLKNAAFESDVRPIDPDCECSTCRNYSRAALHSALNLKLAASATLVSVHNVAYMQSLTYGMRRAIREGRFVPFVRSFMLQQYPDRAYPTWLRNAMEHAEIELL